MRNATFKEGSTVQINSACRQGYLYKRGKVILILEERYQVKFPEHARPLWFNYEDLSKPHPTPAELALTIVGDVLSGKGKVKTNSKRSK